MQKSINHDAELSAKFSPQELDVIAEALIKFSNGFFEQGDDRGVIARGLSRVFSNVSKQPNIHDAKRYNDGKLEKECDEYYSIMN